MDLGLTERQRKLVEVASRLAQRFAERARKYDEANAFPEENFVDLREAGLLTMTIPAKYGGMGIGIDNGDPLAQWLVTKNVARGDSSTGQCLQVHTNMCHLISVLGTEEQRQKFLVPVVKEGAILGGWGSEGRPSGAVVMGGTRAKLVDGGYVLNGRKLYSTNAGPACFGVIFAYLDGVDDISQGLILPVIDARQPGVAIEPEWWDATGMRATVSHAVRLKDVFVPKGDVVGYPGAYVKEQFQARLHPQFSANFIGTAEAIYDFTVRYVGERGKGNDPYVQQHVGEMRIALEAANLMLVNCAWLWQSGQVQEAKIADNRLRIFADEATLKVLNLAIKACGATSLMKTYPLERLQRDLTFYTRHENFDAILATVGKEALNLPYDPGFSRAEPAVVAARTGA